ncbi:MAG: hypothetical protein N4A61_11610 [Pelagimonas sp.]|jgi:hypothetical protein|nr:hypothetical protein [Pelagimonas sp.]
MSLVKEHELHKRRRSRNIGLGIVLAGLIAIVFGLTVVKVTRGGFEMNPGASSGY